MRVVDGYRVDEDLIVPAGDKRVAREMRSCYHDIDTVVAFCKNRDVVLQAGGNCGAWPMKLAPLFGAVYTFEPDPVNFGALCLNTMGLKNVIKLQAALGQERNLIDLDRTGSNCGAHFVSGRGLLPTLRIDDLCLRTCDLLWLDIEGQELEALIGARDTIFNCKPVIVFEENGCGERYGLRKGDVENHLQAMHGYRLGQRLNNDIVMLPPVAPWRGTDLVRETLAC